MPATVAQLPLITDKHHPAITRIRLLRYRDQRAHAGTFFVEGVRFVARAWQRRAPIEALVVAPALLTSRTGRQVAAEMRAAGMPCLSVAPHVFHSLTLGEQTQGIGAVVRQQWTPLDQARPDAGLGWLALERVQSPGNFGSILRTAEATGVAGVLLAGDDIDPFDPAAVRATMGSLFGVHLVRTSVPELTTWARRRGVTLVGTSPRAQTEFQSARYPRPLVLCMGWERRGLSRELESHCAFSVRIPMSGQADSLNVAVATGVVLYELLRRRRGAR